MLRYVRASKLLLLPVLNIHSQVSCPNWDNCVFPRIFFGSFAMCFPFSQNRILLFSSFPFIFMHMFFTFTHLQGSTAKFSLLLSHPGYILNVSAGQVYKILQFCRTITALFLQMFFSMFLTFSNVAEEDAASQLHGPVSSPLSSLPRCLLLQSGNCRGSHCFVIKQLHHKNN